MDKKKKDEEAKAKAKAKAKEKSKENVPRKESRKSILKSFGLKETKETDERLKKEKEEKQRKERCTEKCFLFPCDDQCYMPADHEDLCVCLGCNTADTENTTKTTWSLFNKIAKMRNAADKAMKEGRAKALSKRGLKRKGSETDSSLEYPSPPATLGTEPEGYHSDEPEPEHEQTPDTGGASSSG